MDKLTAIKIKYDDGTYSDEIPVSVLSENVEWDSTHTLVDVLGSIDVDVTGTIQDQISQLFNDKVSNSDMQAYITSSMSTYITNWLNTNVNPVGSAVVVDSSLTISGAAADAKVTGEKLAILKSEFDETSEATNNLFNPYNLTIGMNGTGATGIPYRALSEPIYIGTNGCYVKAYNLPENLKYGIECYNTAETSSRVYGSAWQTTTEVYHYTRSEPYIRIIFGSVDNSSLTREDFVDLELMINLGSNILPYEQHLTAIDNVARGKMPIVDSSLTISGAAADAKKVGDKLANLKSDLKNIIDDYIQIDMIWNDHGYVSTSDGTVIEFENWKYTDYVDISAFKRGYLSTLCIGTGTLYNAFYTNNYTFIESFTINPDTSYIAIPYNAKYIRISRRAASEIKLYSDNRATGLKWYKYDSDDYVTDFIDVSEPKYTLKLPTGYTCRVQAFTPDNVAFSATEYLGSRDWYRLNNAGKVKLYLHSTSALIPNADDIAEITFIKKQQYNKIEYLKIISFNVGLWNDGMSKQPDATANEYAIKFRKFLGEQNPDAVFMFEAPP